MEIEGEQLKHLKSVTINLIYEENRFAVGFANKCLANKCLKDIL